MTSCLPLHVTTIILYTCSVSLSLVYISLCLSLCLPLFVFLSLYMPLSLYLLSFQSDISVS